MQFPLFAPDVLSVTELTTHLRRVVERDDVLADVWVRGEVCDAGRYNSGHFYFSMKDAEASVRCVMWKPQVARLPRLPREGEAINAHGRMSVYEQRGQVQLYVDTIELLGAGALWQEFEELKLRLFSEGLFDEKRKRPLPPFPRVIAIVTSPTGAVLHDIQHILERRYPLPRVFLVPTLVQGVDAPPNIVWALERAQRIRGVDVILLARGGGSIEDLWAFNDERVARAICASRVPIVCGVGHETDNTIADFCADLRAPTPTAAAQFCTPDQNELRANLMLSEQRLRRALDESLLDARRRLIGDVNALRRAAPRAQIASRRQRLDDLERRAGRDLNRRIQAQRVQIAAAERQLNTLNPRATLERGYAIVTSGKRVVTDAAQVSADEQINVQLHTGAFTARVESTSSQETIAK